MATKRVLSQEPLVDEILSHVYADCAKLEGILFCKKRKGRSCIHASTLTGCIVVARLWSTIAARHLWGRYADFPQLLNLVATPQGVRMDGNPWTVTSEQRAGIDRYGKFIKQLVLDGEPDFERECMPILECGALKGQPLLPRMKDIAMKTGWTKNRGAYLALGALISASIETINLEFYYSPSAALMHAYLEIMLPKAACLTTLVLRVGCTKGRPANATPENGTEDANPFTLSYSILHKLTSLRKLALEPSFVTLDLLDIIGTLPNLRRLNFIGARPNTGPSITLPKTSTPPRKAMFRSLEGLRINATISAAKKVLWLYLQDPPSSFLHLFIICEPPTTSGQFAFPEKICQSLLIFDLVVRGTIHALELGHFAVIPKCTNLKQLNITFTSFFRIAEPDIDMLSKLQNLKDLTLNSQPRFLSLNLSHLEWLVYFGPEPDIKTLGSLARALPRLRRLAIAILACETRQLRAQRIPHSFEQLEELEFGQCSFINRCVDGFDEHDAAIYITALVPESAHIKFSKRGFQDTGDDPNWAQLKKDHLDFIDSFRKRLNDYMNVRNNQMLRVTKRLDDSRG